MKKSCFSLFTLLALVYFPQFANAQETDFSFQQFTLQYSTLHTIAGTGKYPKKYVNGWKADYEGKPAINAELSRPHHAISDSKGNIYIADKDAHAIRVIRPSGIIETVAGTNSEGFSGDGIATQSQLSYPNGIFVTKHDALFILDLGNDKVRKLNTDGSLTTVFTDPEGIETGRGLWVSDDEKVIYYSSKHELKQWSYDSGIKVIATGFEALGNIAMSPDKRLFVTDREAHFVYAIDAQGNKLIQAGNGKKQGGGSGYKAIETGLDQVRGIWFHPKGGYFVVTHKGGQVWFVDYQGIIHLFLDGGRRNQHSGDGKHFLMDGKKISEPRAISIDHQGNIIITEHDAGFIRMIRHK